MLALHSQLLVQLVEGLVDDRADSVGGGREGHTVAEETAETGSPLAIEPDKTSVSAVGQVIYVLVDVAGEEPLFVEEGGNDVVDGEGQSVGWVRCGGGGIVAVGDGVLIAARGADGGAAAVVGGAARRVRCAAAQARQGSPLAERAVQRRLAFSMGGGGGETVLVFILGSILVLLDGRGG